MDDMQRSGDDEQGQAPGSSLQDSLGRIRLTGYPARKPFASFLPGIAGPFGIPVWAFYVNRGQCFASFGVQSKDHPILEFQPANKAYQLTPIYGFRTFLNLRCGGQTTFAEPFSAQRPAEAQHMAIGMGELEIIDSDPAAGWEVTVQTNGLLNEPFGGLLRHVTLRNIGASPLGVEMLDGLPNVQPFGVTNGLLKEMGRTLEAWMEVYHLADGMPFYRLRASVADTEQVQRYTAGHFYLPGLGEPAFDPQTVIIDSRAIFGQDTTFSTPQVFCTGGLKAVMAVAQVSLGRTPCAFSGLAYTLQPGEQISLVSVFGHAADEADLPAIRACLCEPGFAARQQAESRAFFANLTDAIETHTAHPLFDDYLRQSFLDNLVRGGLPQVYGEDGARKVFHLYSRKHGDLERDYNAFQVTPEMFSQGNANYRDINQNRRCEVFFNPAVEDSNILTFLNLIQLDGYNPLVLTGVSLRLPAEALPGLLALCQTPNRLAPLLAGAFTPGELLGRLRRENLSLNASLPDFIEQVMQAAEFEQQASFHEGFWIDHWTYNLDLIDAFLAVYPERQASLYFERELTWYESPVSVQPRSSKLVETPEGPRQLGAVKEDKEKAARIAARRENPNLARDRTGAVLRTTLFNKLVALAAIKLASLDRWGMGIEMEAGRPGWYDALNGLPALQGSSLNESHALARLLGMLREALAVGGEVFELPLEHLDLLHKMNMAVIAWENGSSDRAARFWEAATNAREENRMRSRFGLDGRQGIISAAELDGLLAKFECVMRIAIDTGSQVTLPDGQDLPPTYLRPAEAAPDTVQALPPFLEGVVNALRSATPQAACALHKRLLASTLHDAKLGMLRVNASLAGEPHAIGRVRAFPPGWLENESIWTHMSYKYLLELLRKGLHTEFFDAMPRQLPPFLDPAVYGRSPLELSSFIASSAHPDPSVHGAGFVARLSGATAETLSIWWELFTGGHPFVINEGGLALALRPVLPGWLFGADDTVRFRFLGHTQVTLHNPRRIDLLGPERPAPSAYRLVLTDGREITITYREIRDPYAQQVRAGQVRELWVTF